MDLQFFIRLAGIAQVALVLGSLVLPRILGWRDELSLLRPLTRQVFWTYAAYILHINLFFAAISLADPRGLTDGSRLATMLTGFIALYWIARVLIQFVYFDRSSVPDRLWARLGEATLTTVFGFLGLVYGFAFIHNY